MTMSDARRVAAQDSSFFTKPLSEADPEIYAAIEQEHERQQDEIDGEDAADHVDGYVVYHMNNWIQAMQPIVASGKPTTSKLAVPRPDWTSTRTI